MKNNAVVIYVNIILKQHILVLSFIGTGAVRCLQFVLQQSSGSEFVMLY